MCSLRDRIFLTCDQNQGKTKTRRMRLEERAPAERASKKAELKIKNRGQRKKAGRRNPLALGHGACEHQGEAGRHRDRHFDFDR
jgi:hypothetical protein